MPIPVTKRCKTYACSCLIAGNRGFESRLVHGCLCFVFVVCCLGSGLWNEIISRSEESYRARAPVCVCLSVFVCDLETAKQGGLGPIWVVAPQNMMYIKLYILNYIIKGHFTWLSYIIVVSLLQEAICNICACNDIRGLKRKI